MVDHNGSYLKHGGHVICLWVEPFTWMRDAITELKCSVFNQNKEFDLRARSNQRLSSIHRCHCNDEAKPLSLSLSLNPKAAELSLLFSRHNERGIFWSTWCFWAFIY